MAETSERRRRLAAKRHNERLKLLIVSVNALGLTTFGAAFILPMVGGAEPKAPLIWIIVAFALHLLAQVTYV
jgi:dipeptide/tripeptide permease